jgi:exodeoxyribonuclease V alpha subunit
VEDKLAAKDVTTSLSGTVHRITYHNTENNYTVLRLKTAQGEVTAVGTFPAPVEGEVLHLTGEWRFHPQYGKQFAVTGQQASVPMTAEGLIRYLGSGLVKGIGPVLARRLVEHFGADVLRVIAETPEKLAEVPGLGEQRRESLVRGIAAHRAVQEVMVFLQGHGIGPALAARIVRRYGDQAFAVLKRDPYKLADEVFGIGFRTADKLAKSLGIQPDAPERARAAVLYALQQASGEGHMALPLVELSASLVTAYGFAAPQIEKAVREMAATGRLVLEETEGGPIVYLPRLHQAEREAARLLAALGRRKRPGAGGESEIGKNANAPGQEAELPMQSGAIAAEQLPGHEMPSAMQPAPAPDSLSRQQLPLVRQPAHAPGTLRPQGDFPEQRLTAEQLRAVEQACAGGLTVITGGPGTGKTTIVKAILQRQSGRKVLLAAPTGRAAKRLQEATGAKACTIHRLLEFGFDEARGVGVFKRNGDHPLEAEMVIIDEVSMLDIPLAYHLLQAVPVGASLVLVGDADQLPSVGPGNLLRDLLSSGLVPAARLTTVFRQAQESLIVTNAHRINRGWEPIYNHPNKDFFLIKEGVPNRMTATVRELVAERLPRFMQCDPRADIQVLSPVRRGPAGVDALNLELQRALNPRARDLPPSEEMRLLPGDRVMQIRNNYEKMVFNGDIGQVAAIDEESGAVQVIFPDRDESPEVTYSDDELDNLALAYAASVHKSQGSEFPIVVIPLPWVMPNLMSRNLLYTAVTRAKRLVVLVGSRRVIKAYIDNDRAQHRHGRLAARLREEWERGAS